jgi:hypothetical protein
VKVCDPTKFTYLDEDGTVFIYVVHAPTVGLRKVGVSWRPTTRVVSFRTASPVPIEFEAVIDMECGGDKDAPRKIERVAHKLLRPFKSHGEWFSVELEAVYATLQVAREIIDMGSEGDLWLSEITSDSRVAGMRTKC